MIKVLFFAQLAEDAQCSTLNLPHKEGVTARLLVKDLESKVPSKVIDQLRHDFVVLSVNQQLADWDQVLNTGDEVGFLPPFSGG